MEFYRILLDVCPLYIESSVLSCSRIEYLRVDLLRVTNTSNYLAQIKLSIHVMNHFLILSRREITVAINSRGLLMSRPEFYEFLSPFIDIANLYVIDKPRFAFNVDWCLVFGGSAQFDHSRFVL